MDNYRDYLDTNGEVRADRKKNYEAFLYFVDRILPSVNFEHTDYSPVVRKNNMLSQCFTISDEAFALSMVENYYTRWSRKLLAKESRKRERQGQANVQEDGARPYHEMDSDWFKAKWTGSREGLVASGWSKAGIQRFNSNAKMIDELRADNDAGRMLEEHLRAHWRGRATNPKKCKPRQEIVEAFDDNLFDGTGLVGI